jgi:hypothetical protein
MSELDKTIEQLEAEILEEMNDANAPKKSAASPDKMQTVAGEKNDLGEKPEDAAKKVKKASPPQTKTISASTEFDMEDAEELEEKKKMSMKEMEDEEEDEEDDEEMDEMKMMKASKKPNMKEEEDEEDDEEEQEEMYDKKKMKKESFEDRLDSLDVSEDVDALTEGHDLSEEFKEKASVIFEAAIKSKLREEVQRMEEEKEEQIKEFVDDYKDELVEKVDKYLNYVVEQWMTENQLAVERGLKGEIAEDFIAGLKGLFEDHYIDVPNEKYNILESQEQQLENLETKLNEEIQRNIELKNQVSHHIRESIFVEVSEDLSATEKEKFGSLVEELEYIDEESFKFKLSALKESYFPRTKVVSESVDTQDASVENVEVSGTMAKYLSAISYTKSKF